MDFGSSRVEAMEVFTDETKLGEAFGFKEVQWLDCRKISVSIMLMSHDLS